MGVSSLMLAVFAILCSSTLAQTFTSCDPLQKTCPDDPALGKAVLYDFTKGSSSEFSLSTGAFPTFDSSGAVFTIAKSLDSPTMTSKWFIMFGHVEVVVKTAPGSGVVSSVVLQSDDLDEVDWEWLGSQTNNVQTNYFGKGNVTTYTRVLDVSVTSPERAFHTYSVDWTADALTWAIDGKVVRTVTPQNAEFNQYPQTPMQIKIGSWPGGDPSLNSGVIAWAGPIDYSKGPFVMTVQSLKVMDYSTGTTYSYGDKSGSWQSIRSKGGSINRSGNPNAPVVPVSMGTSSSSTSTTSPRSLSSSSSLRTSASSPTSITTQTSILSSSLTNASNTTSRPPSVGTGSTSVSASMAAAKSATIAGLLSTSGSITPGSTSASGSIVPQTTPGQAVGGAAMGSGSFITTGPQVKTGPPLGGLATVSATNTSLAPQSTASQLLGGSGAGGHGSGTVLSPTTGSATLLGSPTVTSKASSPGPAVDPANAVVASTTPPVSIGGVDPTSEPTFGSSYTGTAAFPVLSSGCDSGVSTKASINSTSVSSVGISRSSSLSSSPTPTSGSGAGPKLSSALTASTTQPAGGFATLTRTVSAASTSPSSTAKASASAASGSGSSSTATKNSASSKTIAMPAAIQSAIDALSKKNPGLAQYLKSLWTWFLQIFDWAVGQQ